MGILNIFQDSEHEYLVCMTPFTESLFPAALWLCYKLSMSCGTLASFCRLSSSSESIQAVYTSLRIDTSPSPQIEYGFFRGYQLLRRRGL